jgi:hypothetical protein
MNIAQAQAIKQTRDLALAHAEILKMFDVRVKAVETKLAELETKRPRLVLPVKEAK